MIFWGGLAENYVEFKYPMYIISISINKLEFIDVNSSCNWLHLDCSIRVYRCISKLVPIMINAHSCMHEKCSSQSLGSLGGSVSHALVYL